MVVLSIIASALHHSRCPNRSFAAADTKKLSCVIAAGFPVTAKKKKKSDVEAKEFDMQITAFAVFLGTGGVIPNKDISHFNWVLVWGACNKFVFLI